MTNDAIFPTTAATGIRNFGTGATPGGNLIVGSLNDLSSGTTVSIRNDTSSASTVGLTLGGTGNLGNSVSGTPVDLLYVASGGTFNIVGSNGANTLSLILGQSGNVNIAGTGASTISSVISDGGSNFGLTKTGLGTLALTAANSYAGPTTVDQGTLTLNFAAGAGSNIISSSSKLVFNETTPAASTLSGGTLAIIGAASTTNSQSFNGLTLNPGNAALNATAGAGGTLNVALGDITRASRGGGIDFALPTSGSISTTSGNTATSILGGWATAGKSDWAVSAGSSGSPGALTPLSTYYTTDIGSTTAMNYLGKDLDVTVTVTLAGAAAPNSIRLNTGSRTLTLTGTNNIASGGILFGSGAASGTITGGTLTSSTNELIVHGWSSGTGSAINSAIANNGSNALTLTKTGTQNVAFGGVLSFTGGLNVNGGFVNLGGTSNTYQGQTIIAPGAAVGNGATPNTTTTSVLGATGVGNETIIQNGGYFRLQNSNLTIAENFVVSGTGGGNGAIQAYANNPTFSGTIMLAGSSALSIRPSTSGRTVTYSGVISDQVSGANSNLALFRASDSDNLQVFALTNSNNYGGNTYITDGLASTATSNVAVRLTGGNDRLPTTTVVTLGGVTPSLGGSTVGVAGGAGRLLLGDGLATASNQTVAGLATAGSAGSLNAVVGNASTVSTLTVNNNANFTYGGLLGGGTVGANNSNNLALTKSGTGTLALTGTNPNTYTGATTINGGTLNAAATGALGSTTSLSVGTGGTLLLGGGSSITDRVNNGAGIALNGGIVAISKGLSEGSAATVTGPGSTTGNNVIGLGALTLSADSTLDFDSTGNSTLMVFTTFSPATFTLNVTGYLNTHFDGITKSGIATDDRLVFSLDQSSNLERFNFGPGFAASQVALGNGYYEVGATPIPEPGAVCAGFGLLALVGYRERKRLGKIWKCGA